MSALSDYGSNVYSQFGEDGMVTEVLKRIGDGGRVCVEFGAADGLSCSNTANLWRNRHWRAVLIEGNPDLIPTLHLSAGGDQRRVLIEAKVSATDPDQSIDAILEANGFTDPVDVMSIDVDGDDYWIATTMKARPRLLIVEFNQTIPPHLERFLPTGPGNRLGVGAEALVEAMLWRGYAFVGLSATNAFFVQAADAGLFGDLDTDLSRLQPPEQFMYLATDYDGHIVPCGARPPWGLRWPPSPTRIVPNTPGVLEIESADSLERLLRQLLGEVADLRAQMPRPIPQRPLGAELP